MNQESKSLWIAIGAAVCAVFLLYSHTQEKNKEITKQFGAKKTVVVAKKDIYEMHFINEEDIEVVQRPVQYIHPSAVSDPNELIGKVALSSIRKDEQVLAHKVSLPSAATGIDFQISPGKRALTIPVSDMNGVAKLLKPGSRIDILATITHGKGKDQVRKTITMMQNVPVLATGIRVVNELPVSYKKTKGNNYRVDSLIKNTDFNSITIEATPLESQKLASIMSENPGNLYMTLRHPSDTGPIGFTRGTTTNTLLSIPKKRRPAATGATKPRAPRSKTGFQPLEE